MSDKPPSPAEIVEHHMMVLSTSSHPTHLWAWKEITELHDDMGVYIDRLHALVEKWENDQLTIQRLTKERDEARREVMSCVSERCSRSELTEEYKKRGWEYLKEESNV